MSASFPLGGMLLLPVLASAQLAAMVLPPKVIGQKSVVLLRIRSNFVENVKPV